MGNQKEPTNKTLAIAYLDIAKELKEDENSKWARDAKEELKRTLSEKEADLFIQQYLS